MLRIILAQTYKTFQEESFLNSEGNPGTKARQVKCTHIKLNNLQVNTKVYEQLGPPQKLVA